MREQGVDVVPIHRVPLRAASSGVALQSPSNVTAMKYESSAKCVEWDSGTAREMDTTNSSMAQRMYETKQTPPSSTLPHASSKVVIRPQPIRPAPVQEPVMAPAGGATRGGWERQVRRDAAGGSEKAAADHQTRRYERPPCVPALPPQPTLLPNRFLPRAEYHTGDERGHLGGGGGEEQRYDVAHAAAVPARGEEDDEHLHSRITGRITLAVTAVKIFPTGIPNPTVLGKSFPRGLHSAHLLRPSSGQSSPEITTHHAGRIRAVRTTWAIPKPTEPRDPGSPA